MQELSVHIPRGNAKAKFMEDIVHQWVAILYFASAMSSSIISIGTSLLKV